MPFVIRRAVLPYDNAFVITQAVWLHSACDTSGKRPVLADQKCIAYYLYHVPLVANYEGRPKISYKTA